MENIINTVGIVMTLGWLLFAGIYGGYVLGNYFRDKWDEYSSKKSFDSVKTVEQKKQAVWFVEYKTTKGEVRFYEGTFNIEDVPEDIEILSVERIA